MTSCQEKKAGCPAAALSNVSASAAISGWNVVELRLAVLDALQEARHGGQHAAQRRIGRQRRQQGLRARQAFDRRLNLRSGRNNKPLRSKNGPPSGRRTPWNSPGLRARAADRRLAASSASSGVAPSITTIVSLCSDGKARS